MKKFWARLMELFYGKKIAFGLKQASVIYDKTKGRFNDGSKAVPFAILATAELLGCDICIQEEAETSVEELDIEIATALDENEAFEEVAEAEIEALKLKIVVKEMAIEEAAKDTERHVQELSDDRNYTEEVADFFNV
jgi:hypothetical protein